MEDRAMAKAKKHTNDGRSTPYPGAPRREIAGAMSELAAAIKATNKSAEIANGERLLEAKKLSRESGYFWLPWLKHECGFGQRRAQRLMNIAKKSDKFVGLDAPTSALGLLARQSTPAAAIEAVAARGRRVSFNEVRSIIADSSPRPQLPAPPPRMVDPEYGRGEEEAPAYDYVQARHRGMASELLRTVGGAAGIVRTEDVGEVLATLTEKRQRRLLADAEDLVAGLRLHTGRTERREPAKAKPDEAQPGEAANVVRFPGGKPD
jgi:hypothetical protein